MQKPLKSHTVNMRSWKTKHLLVKSTILFLFFLMDTHFLPVDILIMRTWVSCNWVRNRYTALHLKRLWFSYVNHEGFLISASWLWHFVKYLLPLFWFSPKNCFWNDRQGFFLMYWFGIMTCRIYSSQPPLTFIIPVMFRLCYILH